MEAREKPMILRSKETIKKTDVQVGYWICNYFILQDNEGDVGILVAGWVGAQPGIKGLPPTRYA